MIELGSLRIGNKVKVTISNDAGVYTVLSIPSYDLGGEYPCVMIDRCPKELVPDFKLKPILLTENILIAAKFHKDNYGVFEKIKDDKPYVSSCEIEYWTKKCKIKNQLVWDICVGEDFASLTHLAYIKYLHQLQNLIFALTNRELEITL